MKTITELETELTELIEKKTQNLNIPSIDKLIKEKRNEIVEVLDNIINR